MKFKELDKVNAEPAFRESQAKHLKNILMLLTLGGAAIVLVWQLFDRFYFGSNIPRLFWLRISIVVLYAFNPVSYTHLDVYKRQAAGSAYALHLFFFLYNVYDAGFTIGFVFG